MKIDLKDIIWDKIEFRTEVLINLLNKLKSSVITYGSKDLTETIVLFDCIHKLGKGGMHSKMPPVIIDDSECSLIDLDYDQFYPNVMLSLGIRPKYGESFLNKLKMLHRNYYKSI